MTKTLTRIDLAKKINKDLGIPTTESLQLVDRTVDEVISAIINQEELKISSFGTFKVRKKKARIGRNPKTKETKTISARKVAVFRPSKLLSVSINR
ncbi:MAG: HU family DNA-binding protein [Alphaproteobacteria bacterium]|jgi:integration host factor subunit alpha